MPAGAWPSSTNAFGRMSPVWGPRQRSGCVAEGRAQEQGLLEHCLPGLGANCGEAEKLLLGTTTLPLMMMMWQRGHIWPETTTSGSLV